MLNDLTLIDYIGISGSLVIAGAYLAVSRGWVDAAKPAFHILNLIGAGLILTSLYDRPNPGAIVIEVLWVMIGIWALISYWRKS